MKHLLLALCFWSWTPSTAFLPVCTSIHKPALYSAFGPSPRDKRRREKQNKYKKSEAETKDPLELLMEESKAKMESIETEKKNFFVPKKQKTKWEDGEIETLQRQQRNFAFPDNKDIDPNDPASFGFVEIGTVVGAHGVHGEIKVKSSSGFPKRFTEPGVKFFKPPNKRAPRKVVLVSGRPCNDEEYILLLAETNNRDEATRLRGGTLFVREEDRELGTKDEEENVNNDYSSTEEEEQEEFFISDLVGLEVFLESKQDDKSPTNHFVGTVAGVVLAEEMCAIPGLGHDMLEINLPRGKGRTPSLRDELVLIPFVPQLVPRVSISERSVFISPPEGLLDLTYVREEKIRIKGFLPPAKD